MLGFPITIENAKRLQRGRAPPLPPSLRILSPGRRTQLTLSPWRDSFKDLESLLSPGRFQRNILNPNTQANRVGRVGES